jgi:uncharacterized protein (TIGR02757 family)
LGYKNPRDQEVTAFIAAVFSYGNVKQIQNTLGQVFSLLGTSPYEKIKSANGKYWKKAIPKQFKHRFNTADDLGCLLTWLGEILRHSNSLEEFFFWSQDKNPADNLEIALENFVGKATSLPCHPYKPAKSKGVHFFFTRPSGKSACKRLLLFLRWVVGTGKADLGLWKKLRPNVLLIPVDTHVLRISRHLGLTQRKDNSWRTAQDITNKLKLLDPNDPTRFDFALCHLGISQECPSRYKQSVCTGCRMNDLCLTYGKVISSRK